MAKKEEIEAFLREFKQKMKIWDVLFRDDRGKNAQTLADLEMRPIDRKGILENLSIEDYCQGPLSEKLYKGADLWVFGKEIKKNEFIYQNFHRICRWKCSMHIIPRCKRQNEISF